jgi:endonuclease VIII
VLRACSPQGRFEQGAAMLDGRLLVTVDAHGKHLLYRVEDLTAQLHIHLGLFGRFQAHRSTTATPTPETRLILGRQAEDAEAWHLAGPSACELLTPEQVSALRGRLGPDPLDDLADVARFLSSLRRRRSPIGQVLLDQRVIAGVGNVFRAEALFVSGLHPSLPAHELGDVRALDLWHVLVGMLTQGERMGRIVTVCREDATGPIEELPVEDARYVYRRDGSPCRRCDTIVERWRCGGREIYVCPACQPRCPNG